MNQDTMTPVKVAFEVEHMEAIQEIKKTRTAVEEKANIAVIRLYLLNNV